MATIRRSSLDKIEREAVDWYIISIQKSFEDEGDSVHDYRKSIFLAYDFEIEKIDVSKDTFIHSVRLDLKYKVGKRAVYLDY